MMLAKVGTTRSSATSRAERGVRQIERRLPELSPAGLRKVRDYEKRNQNRKGVVTEVDKKLA